MLFGGSVVMERLVCDKILFDFVGVALCGETRVTWIRGFCWNYVGQG